MVQTQISRQNPKAINKIQIKKDLDPDVPMRKLRIWRMSDYLWKEMIIVMKLGE